MVATAKKKTASKPKTRAASRKKTRSAAAGSTASSAKATKKVTLDKLKKFNIFAGVSSAIFAIISVIFMSKETVVANLPYGAKDAFASVDSTVFGPAYKTLCEVEIRYVLAFIFGLSAIFSFLLATRLRKKYEAQLTNSVSALRWIFSGITLGLILGLSSNLTQVNNIVTLKTTGALVIVTVILWIMSEGQNKTAKGKLSIFYLSLFTLFLAVMPLLSSLVSSGIYSTEWFGWHVYALAVTTVAGLIALVLTQYKASKKASAKSYLELEGKYLSIDYLVKFSTFIILLGAFLK